MISIANLLKFLNLLQKKSCRRCNVLTEKEIKLETRSKSVRAFLLSEIGHPGKNNFTPLSKKLYYELVKKSHLFRRRKKK